METVAPTDIDESFRNIIDANITQKELDKYKQISINCGRARLTVRKEGGYTTEASLVDPGTGEAVDIFPHIDGKDFLSKRKLPTSDHIAVPMGEPKHGSEDIGGQHGYLRWTDWYEKPDVEGDSNSSIMVLRGERTEPGITASRIYELRESSLTITSLVTNAIPPEDSEQRPTKYEADNTEHTSIGEHAYFELPGGDIEGLKIDGSSLNELIGDGSEKKLLKDNTLFHNLPTEGSVIEFPDGKRIKISATFEGDTSPKYPVAMWIWKREGTDTICFEPMVGVNDDESETNNGVALAPGQSATLSVTIELLSSRLYEAHESKSEATS